MRLTFEIQYLRARPKTETYSYLQLYWITTPRSLVASNTMSMLPFFPSLKPSVVNSIWFDVDVPCDEESELREMEKEHQDAVWEVTQLASDLHPFGRPQTAVGPESEEEDNNDDSDETDSHDNDEDEDDMEGIDNNQINVPDRQ